ncbi:MAG: hypothetical protein QOH81_1683 [Sphingomonadales bacterium]|jgi:hypothetical protein|nr:hypothetical protein [Sphingomonadales bacterium]
MRKSMIVLALVAGCGARDQPRARGGGNGPDGTTAAVAASDAGLIGLYQSGGGVRPSQMCIVEKGAKAQFGITLWGPNLRACSGAGAATRSGDRLRLAMAGDSPCTLDARLEKGIVTLPDAIPAGCAYYCGAGTSFAGARLAKQGGTVADAMKAKDVAGEKLCG